MNYGDVEFVVYLNFFLRRGLRTRIVGTVQQRDTLAQLLTLTIHGVFDPGAREQPSFEELHRRYGVPDLETYDFLRLALRELRGTRALRARMPPCFRRTRTLTYTVLSEEGRPSCRPVMGAKSGFPAPGGCAGTDRRC